jgi:hypothetical protein
MRALFLALSFSLISLPVYAGHIDELLGELSPTDRAPASTTPIDWRQPPVGCVGELVPSVPERGCLDLSQVADPQKEFPPFLSPEEQEYWQSHKRQLTYCRSVEVLKREAARPGSFSPGTIELSWMQAIAVEHRAEKLAAVLEASRTNHMPAQVLTGALFQESLCSELGIAEDGNNYSCGMGQINIVEWCHWAAKQTGERRKNLGLTDTQLDCGELAPVLVKPFYEIAKTRLNGLPEYRLRKEHFKNISYADVVSEFPSAPGDIQKMRYEAVKAFIDSCQNPRDGIAAKANELAALYERFVPNGLKQLDQYKEGEKYQRACPGGYDRAYPLNSGWLLAVGMYNAGPKALDALAFYNRWTKPQLEEVKTFRKFTPADMIKSFYWAGKYNKATDKIDVVNLNGSVQNWLWFKTCVLQRHVARVIQHVTLPGTPNFVDSLEGQYPCAKSTFDESGKLVKSGVPPFRKTSSGMKGEPPKHKKKRFLPGTLEFIKPVQK